MKKLILACALVLCVCAATPSVRADGNSELPGISESDGNSELPGFVIEILSFIF
jgi:hypothetical protein